MNKKKSYKSGLIKSCFTDAQYNEAIEDMNISMQSKDISFGVMVNGASLKFYSKKYNISNAAIHQLCKRIKNKYFSKQSQINLPKNLNIVVALIPETQMAQFESNQVAICKLYNLNREAVIAQFYCDPPILKSSKNFSR